MAQDDFSDRLRRIHEKKEQAPKPAPKSPPPIRSAGRSKPKRPKTKSPINLRANLILGALLVASVAGAAAVAYMDQGGEFDDLRGEVASAVGSGGPQNAGDVDQMVSVGPLETMLLDAAVRNQDAKIAERRAAEAEARATTLIAPPEPADAPLTEPLTTDRLGPAMGQGYAATADGTPVALTAIMVGLAATGPESTFGAPTVFENNSACTLRPIGADETFANVNIMAPTTVAPLQMLDDTTIYAALEDGITERLEKGQTPGMLGIVRGGYRAIDVIVTDRSGPLYLMLQSLSGNIVWNIHAASGVDIAHIAMVSPGNVALTGNIGNASFEALRARDFQDRVDFNYYSGEPEDFDCMAWPYQKPDETWGAWAGAQSGNAMDGNLLFSQDEGFDAYDHWFNKTLGRSSREGLITAWQAPAVLVGNLPSELLDAPQGTRPLYVTAHDHIITGDEAAREAATVALYSDVVAQAAGGDYRDTIPQPTDIGETISSAGTIEGRNRSFGDLIMDRNNVEEVVSLTDLNRERRAFFRTYVGWDEILAPGEAMPPEALQKLYGLLRAPRVLQQYCTDTLVEIASKCGMYKATVRGATINDADILDVRGDFAYVPNYTIGDVTRISNGSFLSVPLLDDAVANRSAANAEDRRAFLADLKKLCDALRAEHGNCLINVSGFDIPRPDIVGQDQPRPASRGAVSVYGVDTRFAEANLEEQAEALFEEIQGAPQD